MPMKLKELQQDVEAWSRKAKREIDLLINSEVNELNPACLARILSICTGLSAAVCAQKLKEAGLKTKTIEDQIKTFYKNI